MNNTLSAEEIKTTKLAMDAAADKQSLKEQRRQSRQTYHMERHVILLTESRKDVIPIVTRELSQGGIGFMTLQPFKYSQEFILQLPHPTGTLVIRCITRHVEEDKGSYLVGASFEEIYKRRNKNSPDEPAWVKNVASLL